MIFGVRQKRDNSGLGIHLKGIPSVPGILSYRRAKQKSLITGNPVRWSP